MKILFSLLLPLFLWGVTLQEINSYPRSQAKDFYIWQFLKQQSTTPSEAEQAFIQLKNVSWKIFKAYAEKSHKEEVKLTAHYMEFDDIDRETSQDLDAVKVTLDPYKATKLSQKRLQELYTYYKDDKEFNYLQMLKDKNFYKKLEHYSPELFLKVFNNCGSLCRESFFNTQLSLEYLYRLSKEEDFAQFIKLATTNEYFTHLQRTLLKYKTDLDLDAQSALFLGLNFLKYNKKDRALYYFQRSYEKAYFSSHKDRALFWIYMTLKDKKYLQELTKSFDINIYTLYADELLNKSANNYYTTLPTAAAESFINLQNPFEWNSILNEIKNTKKSDMHKLAEFYNAKNLLPVQSFIYERASGYKESGYLMPYDKFMPKDRDKRSLMYALMRQESRFIPSALSYSFALGTMQIMPFLVKHLNKSAPKKINELTDMFNPEYNIEFASRHIDWLMRKVYHPLFIAYAYNGGIGFTKRLLLSGKFAKKRYEPFMSMELMQNSESREYGKKVLANYVMYKKILHEEISIQHLFNALLHPRLSDTFRESTKFITLKRDHD